VKKQQCPHGRRNAHKITKHTRQLQQYTQDSYNNKHETTTTIHVAFGPEEKIFFTPRIKRIAFIY
jgi:hypothetical protein